MEHLTVGTVTFTPVYPNNLHEVLDTFKMLKFSCDAGWNAFYKLDDQLSRIKECLCEECLLKVEALNGKEVHGQNRRGNKKARVQTRCNGRGKKKA